MGKKDPFDWSKYKADAEKFANQWRDSGKGFTEFTRDFKKKAEEMKKKAEDQSKNFDKDWHKKYTQKNTGESIFNKPREWVETMRNGTEDEKKEVMKKLFMGFAGLFVLKLLLGGLFGGGRHQQNPYANPY